MRKGRFPTKKPSINSPLTAANIILPKASITKTNSMGDKGSPCLNPQELLKNPIGVPLTKTEKRIEEIQWTIHEHHFFPKPHHLSIYNRKSQLTCSYAFSKSILQMTPGLPDLSLLSRHSLAIRTGSRIYLSLMKALWDLEMIFSIIVLSLLVKILAIIL